MKLLKKINWGNVAFGLILTFYFGIIYLALTDKGSVSQPVAGTLVCHAEGQMTAALQTTDGKYSGDGMWRLKHDKSGTYTWYVKAND